MNALQFYEGLGGGGGEGKKKAYEKERSVSGSADTHQLQMCAYSEVS